MRCAILTVSTTLARGEGEDASGPALAERAAEAGAEVVARDVIGDDAEQITAWLRRNRLHPRRRHP
jgi:molybdopterin biosynthesis enzyme MoaB